MIDKKGPPAKEELADEPVIEETKKPAYVEKDPNYVPPPSTVSPMDVKTIDTNLHEVFNFYSRKFASVRGDF